MADLAQIIRDIQNGFSHKARQARDDARASLNYYNAEFHDDPLKAPEGYAAYRVERFSLFLQRVIDVLSANLYRTGPQRRIPGHAAAEATLNQIYKRRGIDAILQIADAKAIRGGYSAIQVIGSDDPAAPVDFLLWDRCELEVWTVPGDPRKPYAVATTWAEDEQRFARVWTEETVVELATEKRLPGQTAGGTTYRTTAEYDNPYRLPDGSGVLPFAFFHLEFPATGFSDRGLGDILRKINHYINRFLTNHGDGIEYTGRPVLVGKNVRPGWRPPTPFRPGDYWTVPGDYERDGNPNDPELGYLNPDLGFIEAGWGDLNSFIEHSLEMMGVPPAVVRLVQTSARSGESIKAEQLPLLDWAEARQRPFGFYELDLAVVTLRVLASHLRDAGLPDATLDPAADARELVLKWAPMVNPLPGPQRDEGDKFELDNGLASAVEVIRKRRGLDSDEEAIEVLRRIAEHKRIKDELFPQPEFGGGPDGGMRMRGDGQGQGPPEGEGDDEGEGDPEGEA